MNDSQQVQQQTDFSDPNNDDSQQVPQESSEKEEEIPETPVSAPSKESGPSLQPSSETLVTPSVPEMEVSHELKEKGVEAVMETPKLTPEDANAGIVHAKESTPVSTQPTGQIVLPMTQQQAQQTIKLHKKVKDSLFWFAMLIMRQWQIAEKRKK